MNGVVILLQGGHKIETEHNWAEISELLHEDENDNEFLVSTGYGKWVSIIKSQVVAYENIIE